MSNSTFGRYELQSVSDVNREHLSFELLDGNENIVLDMGMSDSGRIEIMFGPAIVGHVFDLAQIGDWIARGKELIYQDLDSDEKAETESNA